MSHAAAFRVKKLKGATIILVAAKHNKRTAYAKTREGRSIDPARSHLNQSLLGAQTPQSVADNALRMMKAAGVLPLRTDAVRGLEFIVSLPLAHGIDEEAYCRATVAWIGARYGGMQNILSADIHRDESRFHMHVLVLPLIHGRMNGSQAIGGRPTMKAMQRDFEAEVALPSGLSERIPKLLGTVKVQGTAAVIARMELDRDPALLSALWPVFRAAIEASPEPYMTQLNIAAASPKPKRVKSFTDYGISKGKGPKTESRAGTIRERVGAAKPRLCRLPHSSRSSAAHRQH